MVIPSQSGLLASHGEALVIGRMRLNRKMRFQKGGKNGVYLAAE